MNSELRRFLTFLTDNRKPHYLHFWLRLFLEAKDGVAEIPFYAVQGLYKLSRPTLYRMLEDGKEFGVKSQSRKKVVVITFPADWATSTDEPQQLTIDNTMPVVDFKKKCHKACMKTYSDWFIERNEVAPSILAADAAGLKKIVAHLFRAVEQKTPDLKGEEVCDRVERAWTLILSRWDTLNPFLQGQVKLSQINSNLTNILNAIKNPQATKASNRTSRFAQAEQDLH